MFLRFAQKLMGYRDVEEQEEITEKLLAYADCRDKTIEVLVKTRMELATELNKAHELNRELEHQLLDVEERARILCVKLDDMTAAFNVAKTNYQDVRELFVAADNRVRGLKGLLKHKNAQLREKK
jgi:hypothetical protein